MQTRISKRILLYLFILLLLGTPINKKFLDFVLNKNFNFEISSSSEFNDDEIIKELSNFKNENLFFLKKEEILKIMDKYKIIEDYYIYKNYPSKMNIKFKRTQFLAITQKNGVNYYIGSNGNFIKILENPEDLPIIFGSVDAIEFLKLKKQIDNSVFNFSDIKNLYYFKSKRWDIETKDGLVLKLPRNNLVKSIELFIKIINQNEFQDISIIDLRQNNQIILNG
tara:strand:+ start:4278 stop:4949 length:672 start_codon:yes stop_codon:yes gene_type:complete